MREKSFEPIIEHYRKTLTGVRRERKDGRLDIINTDNGVGLLEFSPGPEKDLHKALREWQKLARVILSILKEKDFLMLGLGMHPVNFDDRNRRTEKDWYLILCRWLANHYRFMSPAAHQCAVDVTHDEALRAVNTLNALSNLAVALCANSPIAGRKLRSLKEFRLTIWDSAAAKAGHPDGDFFGQAPDRPFKDFDDYLHRMWQLKSAIFSEGYKKGGKYIPGFPKFERFILSGHSWKAKNVLGEPCELAPAYEYVNAQAKYGWHPAKLHYTFTTGSLGELLEAYKSHEVNDYFKKSTTRLYIEFRPCPTQPPGQEALVAALALGLIENLEKAEEFVSRYSWDDFQSMKKIAMKDALSGKWRGKSLVSLASEMVEIARAGLKKRKFGEEIYLKPFEERIKTCRCPADDVIDWWKEGKLKMVLEKTKYRKI